MPSINPYLNFPGTTEAAFLFYQSIFGGEFIGGIRRFGDNGGGENMPAHERDKILHIALPIGSGNMIMGTDALESQGQVVTMGNAMHLCLSADTEAEADRLFKGLSDGASITMPMQKTFWGSYFGMLTDRFGVQWMIDHRINE